MSDTTTDETTETEPTTFGIDVTESEETYRKEIQKAERTYYALTENINKKLDATRSAVHELLGDDQHEAANHINGLLSTLTRKDRDAKVADAGDVRSALIEAADEKRNAVLEKDPFIKRAATVIKRQYGSDYSVALIENAPFTFESLRTLASARDWCADYEQAMGEFVRAGALPDETRVVTREVHWTDVPASKKPKQHQVWEANLTLPAYVRDANRYGDACSYLDLRDYAKETEYVLVQDVESAGETEYAGGTDF